MGEFLYQLGVGQLRFPWGVAIHRDNVYVSYGDDTVSKFSLINTSLVKQMGGKGSNNRQFNSPGHLTIDLIGRVFIPDTGNHRICIHDTNLNHLYNITDQCMSYPYCVKVCRDLVCIVSL